MEQWLQLARGPLFIMTFLFMVLSLLRLLAIQLIAIRGFAGQEDGNVDLKPENVSKMALEWLVPTKTLMLKRPVYTIITVLWVLCLIAVPILLINHMLLWERGMGFGFWPNAFTFSGHIADTLTVSLILLTILLLIHRAATRNTRLIKEPIDSIIFLTLILAAITGILMTHPTINPFNYSKTLLTHVFSAEAIFIMLPMSKIAHTLMYPIGSFIAGKISKLTPETTEKIAAEVFGGKEVSA